MSNYPPVAGPDPDADPTLAALLAPLIATQDPFDLASLDVLDATLPPVWLDGSDPRFLLGTDAQGRDLLSAILYGTRISLTVGVLAVLIQAAIGVPLGLIAGYAGGRLDTIVSRAAVPPPRLLPSRCAFSMPSSSSSATTWSAEKRK